MIAHRSSPGIDRFRALTGILRPPDEPSGLGVLVIVNQAIGVLIRQGLSPEAADAVLDANALSTGGNRRSAADVVLAGLAG